MCTTSSSVQNMYYVTIIPVVSKIYYQLYWKVMSIKPQVVSPVALYNEPYSFQSGYVTGIYHNPNKQS